ncbi:trypsin-like peptidase domain-containing protein [Streptomyces sp. NPDC059568]|uniref:nSTAND1 domain-containing NTPase n=1 Tax=Streptomyces sp. NPDC059568 TaxID=3346868 RepID=UPI0036C077A7
MERLTRIPLDGGAVGAIVGPAMVRIRGRDGTVAGAGFLISPELVCTCAHVVAKALGISARSEEAPDTPVPLDLPFLQEENGDTVPGSSAQVVAWRPIRPDERGDIAILRLPGPAPRGAHPLRLVTTPDLWGHTAQVFGFPGKADQGKWAAAEFRDEQALGWVQMDAPAGGGGRVAQGFSGSPVWDRDLSAVVGMTVAVEDGGQGVSYLIPSEVLREEIPEYFDGLRPPCPYRGLEAFGEQDAEVFHGRGRESARLLTAVSRHPVVVVAGPSGSGKSSLVNAGLLPVLHADGVRTVTLRPVAGQPPRRMLANSLLPLLEPDLGEVERLSAAGRLAGLLDEPEELASLAERLLATAGRLLLFVDQYEELVAGEAEQAREFLELLVSLAGAANSVRQDGIRAVLTLRSAALDQLLTVGTAQLLEHASVLVPPMGREQLREAVRLPAERLGVAFQDGLDERIVRDAIESAAQLPLVEFVLTRLWDEQSHGLLTHLAYDRLGGVTGALAAHADQVHERSLTNGDRALAQRLFVQLARPAEPDTFVSRPAEIGRLEPALDAIAQRLAAAPNRLVVIRQDEGQPRVAALAHEALIREWKPLREWLSADREFRAWQEGLRFDLGRWAGHGRAADQLPAGEELRSAEAWALARRADMSAEELAYIRAGTERREAEEREARRRARAKRNFTIGLAVTTVLALVASVLFLVQNGQLDEQNNRLDEQLRRAASAQLATAAEQMDDTSLVASALLDAAAYRTAPEPAALSGLIEQYQRLRNVERVVLEERGEVEDVLMSDDGERFAVHLAQGDLLSVRSRQQSTAPLRLAKGNADKLAMSSDGRVTVLSTGFGQIVTRDEHNRRVVLRSTADALRNPRGATSLRFDRDGRKVLATLPGEGVLVWDVDGGSRIGKTLRPPRGWQIAEAWFGDGNTVVGRLAEEGAETAADGGRNGRLAVWELTTGKARPAPGGDTATAGATVSGDGTTLVRCTADNVLQVWDITGTPRLRNRFTPYQVNGACPLTVPRLDATGRYLLANPTRYGGRLGHFVFLVLDLRTGLRSVLDLPATAPADPAVTGAVQLPAVAFAGPPSALRAAVGVGGTVVLARVPPPSELETALLTGLMHLVDADHRRVVTVDANGLGLRLWDLDSRRQLAAVRPSQELPRGYPAVSPDGTRMVTGTADGRAVLVWELPGLREVRRIGLPAPEGIDPGRPDPRTALTPAGTDISFGDEDTVVVSSAGVISRWKLSSGEQTGTAFRPEAAEQPNRSAEASGTWGLARPGHEQAVVKTAGSDLVVWDFARGERVTTIKNERGLIKHITFDPEGRRLAVVRRGGEVQVRDLEKDAWLPVLAYNGVAWLGGFPSSRELLTQSTTNEAVVWDVDKGSVRYRFALGWAPMSDFDAEGKTYAQIDGSDARIVPLDPEVWFKRMCEFAGRGPTDGEKNLMPAGSRPGDLCG